MRAALIRHVVAIAALPFIAAVLVPLWIARRGSLRWSSDTSAVAVASIVVGICALLLGAALFASSLRRFAREGEGTLAPWDPPRRLVMSGPYRYVRNPMISGVLFVLLGEAAVARSAALLEWAAIFFVINAVNIPLIEEPMLAARFGSSYDEYRRHVPRLVPRLTPWKP